ncbi:MAG: hypothetical protein NTZ08_05705 [Verrucomicrobia bacterium]|nr:hypothetical protein [Verrucomicrobiota bacterium]
MEQLVLLLIIGAISLINWLIEQSGKRREQRRFEAERARREAEASPYQEPARSPASLPEVYEPEPQQEMRRFLESFGIPMPEEVAPQEVSPEIPTSAPVQAAAPAPRAIVRKLKPTPSKSQQVLLEIKSPAALRQAIVWREILGPPRSLQPH